MAANRRSLHTLALTRHCYKSILSSNPSLQHLSHFQTLTLTLPDPLKTLPFTNLKNPNPYIHFTIPRHFSSNHRNNDEDEGEGEDDDDDDEDEDDDEEEEEEMGESGSNCAVERREYSLEEKENEAAAIGYKVIGPLDRSDRVFKPYEPVYAVIQIGSHQFKVSNGDCIYTERLKFCEVNDKLILNRVLMMGSRTQTMIGRPLLPDAAVHAIVEEHALDAKVIIFKKKRRKNYRRTKGHRQELTKLRITDIQGIEKPETTSEKTEKAGPGKTEKAADNKVEKVAVAA